MEAFKHIAERGTKGEVLSIESHVMSNTWQKKGVLIIVVWYTNRQMCNVSFYSGRENFIATCMHSCDNVAHGHDV